MSARLPLPSVRGVDRRYGWRYEPTGISANGAYIEAIAINDKGYTHPRGWKVEAGTIVDVRFRIAGSRLGRIFFVVGWVSCDHVEAVQTELDLSPFADGVYTIQVTNAQRSTVRRVLLRK